MWKKSLTVVMTWVLVISGIIYTPKETGAAGTGIDAPSDVQGYNFYAQGTGYKIVFKQGADEAAVSYNLYIDDSPVVTSFSASSCSSAGKKGYVTPSNLSANLFTQFASPSENAVHDIYVEAVDANGNKAKSAAGKIRITSAAVNAQPASDPTNLSRVYIMTNDATDIDSYDGDTKDQSKQSASIVVKSGDSHIKNAYDYGTIKLRGNTTSFADKKAYNISFNSKTKVISEAVKGKKWCLIANAYDKTLIRSKMAMEFGAKLGHIAVPGAYYTDVYVNGVYKGVYILCEAPENGRAGISYDDSNNGIAIELEQNNRDESASGVAYYTTSRYGMRFCTEDLEDQVEELYQGGTTSISGITAALQNSSPKFSNMIQTLNSFETALSDPSSTSYLSYIDVNSFVDMYIVNELFQTNDFGYSSVKFYITYSGSTSIIHAGPLWDFDISAGNPYDNNARSYNQMRCQSVNAWFGRLMMNPDFVNRVKERYDSMQDYIVNLYQNNTLGTNEIDKTVAAMGASKNRNYTPKANGGAGWSESAADSADATYHYSYSSVSPYSSYSYSQHIEYLRGWLQNKNEFLLIEWGLSEEPTTEEPITEEPTTEEPTTEEPTTDESTPEEDFKIASKTLALSSGISLIFKVNGNLFENRYENPKLVVVMDGIETELTEYTVESNGKYAFEFTRITPNKMNIVVGATLHAYKNGKEYVSPEVDYSVATYCYNMLGKYGETAGYEKLRTLLVDLLNYGVASQNYTGFNTDNPANSELTATQRSWGSGDLGELTNVKNNQYVTIDNPDVIWKTSSLALQDAVIVKMKFQTESTDGLVMRVRDDYGLTWDIEPGEFESAVGTDNQYYVSFKGFNVGRMSDCMYFTAYRGNTPVSNTYRYSVESYVYAHQSDANTLGALVVAMMKYGNSAREYNS